MIEVTLLIPLAGNDGAAFSPEHHAAFEAHVLGRFGGLSRLPGTVAGKWIGEGQTYTDQLVAYVVALASLVKEAAALGEVVTFAKAHYGQEAIYIRYLGLSEVL